METKYLKRLGGIALWFAPLMLSMFVNAHVFTTVAVAGESMEPSFHDGDRVAMSRLDKTYERGEIVVFTAGENHPGVQDPATFYIKRVIAIAGDTVRYKDGKLYVNDKEVDQSFIKDSAPDMIKASYEKAKGTSMPENNYWELGDLSDNEDWNEWSAGENKVPEGTIFVMGDHRSNSTDSRYFGFVRTESVAGVVKQMPFSNEHIQSVINTPKEHFFVGDK